MNICETDESTFEARLDSGSGLGGDAAIEIDAACFQRRQDRTDFSTCINESSSPITRIGDYSTATSGVNPIAMREKDAFVIQLIGSSTNFVLVQLSIRRSTSQQSPKGKEWSNGVPVASTAFPFIQQHLVTFPSITNLAAPPHAFVSASAAKHAG